MKASNQLPEGKVPETKKTSNRKSRRSFDRNAGIVIAKRLFHEHGYDAVGIADLTRALDINPPSLYAAFGSKAGLYERCLKSYVEEGNLPADRILANGRPVAQAISELFTAAANQYVKSARQRGCLVTEGMRADDPDARSVASKYGNAAAMYIEHYLRQHYPSRAKELSDYVITTLRGLSAAARVGLPKSRLLAVARLAGQSFQAILTSSITQEK